MFNTKNGDPTFVFLPSMWYNIGVKRKVGNFMNDKFYVEIDGDIFTTMTLEQIQLVIKEWLATYGTKGYHMIRKPDALVYHIGDRLMIIRKEA